ncbi:MAG: hypothetical protein CVU05_07190, partial [Bacteroidetes bacterium HGW-Bacteroidetes-21]
MNRICLIFLFTAFFYSVSAQWKPDTIVLKKPYQQINLSKAEINYLTPIYNINKFNIQHGLPNSYITSVVTDRKGYLWFGSSGGGCGRFNGSQFEIFTMSDGLPSNYIQKIFEDRRGRIWAATYGNGIAKFENNKWEAYTDSCGFPGKYVWDIAEDKQGNLWFAIERKGACIYNGKTFKLFTKEDGLCSPNIRCVYCDTEGNIWFGSDGRGVTVLTGNTFKSYTTENGLPDNRVVSVCEWKNAIWLGTYGGGICRFNNNTFTIFDERNGLANNLISSFTPGKTGKLLIATSGGGISVFNGNHFKNYSTLNGLSNDITISACEDDFGNIWTGTYGGGISVIMNNSFTSFNKDKGLPGNVVKCLLETNNGIWMGFSGAGMGLMKGDTVYHYSTQQGLPSDYILAFTKQDENTWWAGSSGSGLLQFGTEGIKQISNWHGLPGNYILSLYSDSKKRLWIGTYGTGFGFLSNDSLLWFTPNQTLHPEFIHSFAEHNDSIYIGTDAGLFYFNNNILQQAATPKEMGEKIKSLMFEIKGRLWIGTSGNGLWVKTGNKFANMPVQGTIPSLNNIESVFQSPDGKIMAGLWNGMIQLIPQNNQDALKFLPEFLEFRIKYFSDNSGFQGYNCLTNSYLIDKQNRLWMGAGQVLIRSDIDAAPFSKKTPYIELIEIRRQFSPIHWKNLIDSGIVKSASYSIGGIPENPSFRYDYNHLTFTIRTAYLNNHKASRIKYRLQGLEHEFSPPTDVYDITYSNIPPGNYCLEVYSINENGITSEKPFQYFFSIRKPWWATTWFLSLVILFTILVVYSIFMYRISLLKKRQKILELKIAQATVEIRDKNDELKQQNDEILAQRDEIESQRDQVTIQKKHIEEIHKDLTDSINYAERIQRSFMATNEVLTAHLKDYFVFFRPKDVVSGDFYWAGKL